MPVKPETRFYRRVNEKLPREIHRQKISSLYGNGTPDFWYSGDKGDAWVEYKWEPKLSRNGVDPTKLLTPLQRKWINDRLREGRSVLVIIGSPQGCAVLQNGAWNNRVPVEYFRYTITDLSVVLIRILHDLSAVLKQGGICYESNVSNPHNDAADSGSSVRSIPTAKAASTIKGSST